MNEELRKLKELMEGIKKQVEDGLISKESADEKFREINEKIAAIQAQYKDIEEKMRVRATAMDGLQDEKEKFSILQAIRGIITGKWDKENEHEKKVMDEYQEKAMSAGAGSEGGYLVPPQAIPAVIELLRANTVVIEMGATVLTDIFGSPVTIARQSGGALGYWVGENNDIIASQLSLEQLSMTPKTVGALVPVSNKLIKLAQPGSEELVQKDIGLAIAEAIDLAALRGSGSTNQPRGITQTSGIHVYELGPDGGDFDFDAVLEMEGKLEDSNALRGSLGLVMHGKVKRKLKKTKVAQFQSDTKGAWVMLPMSDRNLEDHLGYRIGTTTQLPTDLTKGSGTNLSEVIFGNWRELLIAQWGGLQIDQSKEAGDAYAKNQTVIRALQDTDMALRHVQSFSLCNDAKTR